MSDEENRVQMVPIDRLLIKYQNGNAIRQGWSPQCESYPATVGKWGVLKTTAIQTDGFRAYENKQLPDNLNAREHLTVESGDILITCAGPRSRCGIPCFVEEAPPKLMISGKMYQLRVDQSLILPKYLTYFLQTPETQIFIDSIKSGSNDSGLNLTISTFKKILVPKPSIKTQAEIINLIEQSLDVINEGLQELFHAEKKLELYRQSVLKDAFEGKLTADWRAANPDLVEPADKLLDRIEAERKAAHQAELDTWRDAVNQWEANGKDGNKPTKPKAYTSNTKIYNELIINRHLPNAWSTTTIGQISSVGTGVTPLKSEPKFYNEGNIPWVTSSSVNDDPITISENFITHFALLNTNLSLYPSGTLLMAMYGEGKTRGKVSELDFPSTINQAIAAINFLDGHTIIKNFIKNFLKFNYEKNRAVSVGGMQPNLNLTKVKAIEVPICGTSEMEQIIRVVENLNHKISEMAKGIEHQRKTAEFLKQSILKQSFSGYELLKDAS